MGILNRLFGRKPEPQPTPPPPTPIEEPEPMMINEVTPEELKARLDQGDDIVVVDMRQSFKYQAGHIPTSINIFVQNIPDQINTLPKDKDIVFQCWHGNTSLQASAFLIDQGWSADKVASLSGGIAGWTETHGMVGLVRD